ncbi:hypothetical protein EYF80_048751 [Liparis tanakae]|uniref:Uncharacterized protein n=1 Tax=Liparis tanakae TaxID=230148 RepID=A0A4Z2FIP6_9TELE|nr:hypothetical protein EYF80_048751 [Liparis tanakae]
MARGGGGKIPGKTGEKAVRVGPSARQRHENPTAAASRVEVSRGELTYARVRRARSLGRLTASGA